MKVFIQNYLIFIFILRLFLLHLLQVVAFLRFYMYQNF